MNVNDAAVALNVGARVNGNVHVHDNVNVNVDVDVNDDDDGSVCARPAWSAL